MGGLLLTYLFYAKNRMRSCLVRYGGLFQAIQQTPPPPPPFGSAHDVDVLCVRLVEPPPAPPPPPPRPQQPAQCCKKLAFFARSSKISDRILKFHRISLKIEMARFSSVLGVVKL